MVPRTRDRATLDREYDNLKKLSADVLQALFARLEQASDMARKKHDAMLDIAYGPSRLERLDIFRTPKAGSDVHVFFHGGYWHALDKQDFSYVADGLVQQDVTTVVVNYPLLPAVRLDAQVAACRRALRWVYDHIEVYGGNPGRVSMSGHSAGGHLASMLLTPDPGVPAEDNAFFPGYACLVSGIYDLEPIRQCFLNETLHLSYAEVLNNSPVRLKRRSAGPVTVVVGADEGDEYLGQSHDLMAAWSGPGSNMRFHVLDNENHFSLRAQFGDPDSQIVKLVSVW